MHLINSKELLELRSFTKVAYNECVEAGSSSLPILGRGKRVIKKVLNSVASPNSEDLTLSDIVIVKGFYINIVSEARLNKARV
jgi:hypothetical protein